MPHAALQKQDQKSSFQVKPRQVEMESRASRRPQSPEVNYHRNIGNMAVQRLVADQDQFQQTPKVGFRGMETPGGTAQLYNFSNVRIHKDSSSSESLGALAYTRGNDIHFAPAQYNPNSATGRKLISHESGDVVKQRTVRIQSTARENCVQLEVTKWRTHINNIPSAFMSAMDNKWKNVMGLYYNNELTFKKGANPEDHSMNGILKYRQDVVDGYITWYSMASNPEKEPMKDDLEIKGFNKSSRTSRLDGRGEGSDDPTSDIDVNLTGTENIEGCLWINEMFRRTHNNKEWAEVFNVNFYAKDFIEPEMKKSGERPDWNEKSDPEMGKMAKHIEKESTINALIHLMEAMKPDDVKNIYLGESQGLERQTREERYNNAVKKYNDKVIEINKYMDLPEIESNDVAIQRLYEEKLKKILELKERKVDEIELQTALHEAVRFAPDAYYSKGAVINTVVNKQVRAKGYTKNTKENKMKVTRPELIQSVIEQAAFIFEHLDKDKEKAPIEIYTGAVKYLYRFWNAIKHVNNLIIDKQQNRKWRHLNALLKKDLMKKGEKYVEAEKEEKKGEIGRILESLGYPVPNGKENSTMVLNRIREDVKEALRLCLL